MARLAIIWRNPRCSQPKRLCIPASGDSHRSVYMIVESASPANNEWNGLPNLEVIPGKANVAAAAQSRSMKSGA